MRVFTEASGSLTSAYLINAIHQCGYTVIGSDISDFNHGVGMCDEFIIMPKLDDPLLWDKTISLLKKCKVNMVIPSLDESLLGWAERADMLAEENIDVVISPYDTVKIFQDKWQTYKFFLSIDIPTPRTSLQSQYGLIKPRRGRGSVGIFRNNFKNDFSMDGYISQEVIAGVEYTVDALFSVEGKPIYIVPRIRIDVKDGKATKGEVVNNHKIEDLVIKISNHVQFIGPVNFQLFETINNELFFIEINPRIAGGMALSFAATENWIELIVENKVKGNEISPKNINYGLKMARYYHECFI